ncbi:MAG: pyridoxal phosphate-dependent aminotransferase [Myxococcota bacterium]
MKISERAQAVKPSATLAMGARAKAMRAEGVDVLSFSAGEPDFDTPEHIKQAAVAALARGETKYTPVAGNASLRQSVARWSSDRYGLELDSAQVIVGAGAKQVVFNACACLLGPGEEAVIFAPYWVSYPDMFAFNGARASVIETQANTAFLPRPEQLAQAINERTRLVMLNSPNNPCGVNYPRELLEAFAEILRKHPDLVIITDDIYSELVFDGEFTGILHVAPDLAPRTLIIQGVSKSYSMTGWRIGFGIGPEVLIKAMSRIQGASTSGACSISQAAAQEALDGPQEETARMRNVFQARRDRMVEGLRSIEGVRVPTPGGAFYAFPDISAFYGERVKNSFELAEHLLNTQHIATVPGGAFGNESCIRLSFACSEDSIDRGIERLRGGLSELT